MSRIVLLEFADNSEAETFVHEMTDPDQVVVGAEVVAVVARPTGWCKCAVQAESKSQRRRRIAKGFEGFSRGKTFGWWLCPACHKPSRAIVTHFVTNMLAGCNDLLPKILGTGPVASPSERWEAEGGIPNEHANASPGMAFAVPSKARRRRRSDVDRENSTAGRV
jgi:hypothetical protein